MKAIDLGETLLIPSDINIDSIESEISELNNQKSNLIWGLVIITATTLIILKKYYDEKQNKRLQ